VISFILNTNILSHPKKNIWSNICVLSIIEISFFWLVQPTLWYYVLLCDAFYSGKIW
jgi:hypothetical protein